MGAQGVYGSIRVCPESQKGRLEMGSPINRVEFVIGTAKIPAKDISTDDWCKILGSALRWIEPYLKYLAGFKTLPQLLNSRRRDNGLPFLAPNGRLITSPEAMPNLNDTYLKQKTRFVILQASSETKSHTNDSHETRRRLMLLTYDGKFVVLDISLLKHNGDAIVCGSSFLPNSLTGYVGLPQSAVRDCIVSRHISPFGVLDAMYILFHHTIVDREKRLGQMKQGRDRLKEICDRLAI